MPFTRLLYNRLALSQPNPHHQDYFTNYHATHHQDLYHLDNTSHSHHHSQPPLDYSPLTIASLTCLPSTASPTLGTHAAAPHPLSSPPHRPCLISRSAPFPTTSQKPLRRSSHMSTTVPRLSQKTHTSHDSTPESSEKL